MAGKRKRRVKTKRSALKKLKIGTKRKRTRSIGRLRKRPNNSVRSRKRIKMLEYPHTHGDLF